MKRRYFCSQLAMASLASAIQPLPRFAMQDDMSKKLLRPKRLQAGDRIAIVSPSSSASEDHFKRLKQNMEFWGFEAVEGTSLRVQNGFLAGTDSERIADLHWAFSDPDIDAIWCIRGGYGSTRILDKLDFNLIRKHPKAFIGFSDITAFHQAIHQKTGLVSFHGPVSGGEHPELTRQWFRAVLMDAEKNLRLSAIKPVSETPAEEETPRVIRGGKARGALCGGNLCLLAALCGTPFQPRFAGKIVLLEEIDEAPYRIDRMLTQLLHATDLRKAAGIALGIFSECRPKNASPTFSLAQTLQERLGNLNIPVCYGIPFGHVPVNATLPMGVAASLDADALELTLLEPAVV